MSTLLRKKIVNIKMRRWCFACQRSFDAGCPMYMSTCTGDGHVYNLHSCTTCEALMSEFYYGLDDVDDVFTPGCVGEGLSPGQTPEMLLEELRNKKTTKL